MKTKKFSGKDKSSVNTSRSSLIEFIELPLSRRERIKKTIESKALCKREKDHIVSLSGEPSEFLFDFRPLFMDTSFLNEIVTIFWKKFKNYKKVQIITLELGSLTLLGALISRAHEYNVEASGVFVRKSRKKYGRQRIIEGELNDAPIIAIDDLVHSGQSINKILLALRDEGKSIAECFAVMTYEKLAFKNFLKENKIKASFMFSLSDFNIKLSKNFFSIPTLNAQYIPIFDFTTKEGLYKSFNMGPRSGVAWDKKLNRLYYGTNKGKVYCIDSRDGTFIWDFSMKLLHPKGIQSTPLLSNGRVYFGGYDGNVHCLDAKTGKCVWLSGVGDYIHSSPVIDEELDLLFIGLEINRNGPAGALVAYKASSGEVVWHFEVREYLPCTPAYSKKNASVAIGTNDFHLHMLNALTGEKLWSFQANGEIKSAPVFYNDDKNISFGSHDGCIYSLEVATGKLDWLFRTDSAVYSSPIIEGNILLCGSTDRNIYMIDLLKRESVAVIPTHGRIFSTPVSIDGMIMIGNNNGQVLEINPDTLQINSEYQLPDRICSAVTYNDKDKLFYAHTSDDRIFAFKKIKTREAVVKKVEKSSGNKAEVNAIKRSSSVMTRIYQDGSVGINCSLRRESYFKIDGIRAMVWLLIDGKRSEKMISAEIAKLTKKTLIEIKENLPVVLAEFLEKNLIMINQVSLNV